MFREVSLPKRNINTSYLNFCRRHALSVSCLLAMRAYACVCVCAHQLCVFDGSVCVCVCVIVCVLVWCWVAQVRTEGHFLNSQEEAHHRRPYVHV